MVNIPLFAGFHTSQVVQNFFHQQYDILWKGKDTEVSLWSLKFLDSLWLALPASAALIYFELVQIFKVRPFSVLTFSYPYHSLKVTTHNFKRSQDFRNLLLATIYTQKFNSSPLKNDGTGRQLSFSEGLFSVAMLNFRFVSTHSDFYVGPPYALWHTLQSHTSPGGRASVASWRFGSRCEVLFRTTQMDFSTFSFFCFAQKPL